MSTARSHSLAELVNATGFDRRTIVYYIQSGLLPKVGRRGPHTRYPDECLTRLLFIKGVRARQAEGQLLTATLAEIRRALEARDTQGIRNLLDRGLPVDELTTLFEERPAPGPAPPSTPVPVTATTAAAPATTAASPQSAPSAAAAPTPTPTPASTAFVGPTGERRSYGLADAGIRRRPPTEPAAGMSTDGLTETARPVPQTPSLQSPPSFPPQARVHGAEQAVAEPDLGELLRELELRPTMNARRNAPGAPEQWTEIPITSRVYLSVRGLAPEDQPLAEAVGRLLKRALRARPPSAMS